MPQRKKFYLILCTLLAVSACKGEHQATEQIVPLPVATIRSIIVQPRSALSQIELTGTVQPVDKAVIAAKVTGTIEKMSVVLGSRVTEGQLLAKISANEITAKLRQAKTQEEQARRNLERETRLLEKKAATPETVKSMQDALQIAEDAYREATILDSYTTITAPFDGQITDKPANVGDLATPGMPLLVVEDDHQLQVVTAVPETLVVNLHIGDEVKVRIPAAELNTTGKIAEVAPAAEPASRTAPVKIDIGQSPKLRSGQFARVSLPGEMAETLLVPAAAVVPFGQMEKLFVVQEGRAILRLVRTGVRLGDQVEILSGLNPNEEVVTENTTHLVDGQPLEIKQ